jgi:two-component system OmpR family sensor kinase
MDGLKGKVSPSLQLRLSIWLSLVILAGAVGGGSYSFVAAFEEAIELQDDQLREMATLIDRQQLVVPHAGTDAYGRHADPESHIAVQLLQAPDRQGAVPSSEWLDLPPSLADGMHTLVVNGRSWRTFVETLDSGSKVAVSQRTAVRDEIARDSALQTVMPLLILLPLLLLLVHEVIRRMFRPLKKMALDLDRRSEQDLCEITFPQLPSEIEPFALAINQLLSRVAQSVAAQRRFVADAAHELRSPLTALSLQAERLEAADMAPQARERLAALRNGIRRTRSLVDQLLTLARVRHPAHGTAAAVSVQRIFRQVLEDLLPLAEAKNIDIGVVGTADATLMAQEMDLKTLVKNLVDNAIRYTPQGGHIDLAVHRDERHITLQIDDTGPGIPEQERTRVFDPFYRVLGNDEVGSGLGLSIVQTLTERIGGKVTLGYVDEARHCGLRVCVVFPTDPEAD